MLINILTHTPLFVWAILALLIYRGVVAMRDREVRFRSLFIIPVIMLALSLQDTLTKFGAHALPLAAWSAAAATTMLLVWHFGRAQIEAGAAPGCVRIRGSWVPLAMMMAIFVTKYTLAVTLVFRPQLHADVLVSAGVCALFGMFSGYFLGRLARDVTTYRAFAAKTASGSLVAVGS